MSSTSDYSPDNAIFLWTVKSGRTNQILRLVEEEKADLNAANENGDTVLHLIFQNKNFVESDVANLIKTFLDRGADPNAENKREEAILHVAVANRMKSVVELLVGHGADVDKSDKKGNSIAHLFVQDEKNKFFELIQIDKGRSSAVERMECDSANFAEWLIGKGFDFDRENNLGKSALHLTVDSNLQHILLALLKHARDVSVADQHKKSLLHLFLEKNYNFKYEHSNALNWYSDYTSLYAIKIVKLLLEKGASAVALDNFGESPLRMAIEKQETSFVESMLEHHLKSCDDNLATVMFGEVLKSCACWGEGKAKYFLTVLNDLVAKSADVNAKDENGMTPAFHAFHCKNRRAADFLADHGADFAAEILYHALARHDRRVTCDEPTLKALFKLLASKGRCDLNAKNRDDETPLHLAAKSGNVAIVRKLIELGAEVNCKNKHEETPLHLAVQCSQSEELVEFLLESGAADDVDYKDASGRWPLLHAVDTARDENPLVPLLLKWGASVNISNGNQSVFFTALEFRCWSNAMVMLAYGADINHERVVGVFLKLGQKPLFVLYHWIKLKVAELPCVQEYETFAIKHLRLQEYLGYYKVCSREIERLKNTFIDDETSIHAFLHMLPGSRRVYVNNEKLKKIVDCRNLEQHFPQYKDVILASYREAVLWKSLLGPARKALLQFTNVRLPHECCERIFVYLGNQDLVNIIECDEDV